MAEAIGPGLLSILDEKKVALEALIQKFPNSYPDKTSYPAPSSPLSSIDALTE
ncbi:hypothetical protein [Leptospira wolffii]|uniref:hypothetical protein n=1 Tax=Leptospira wolffii TaxID=409998 RepID=UPI00143854AF|nr:hypothetical protein [Leptospira wolffii]